MGRGTWIVVTAAALAACASFGSSPTAEPGPDAGSSGSSSGSSGASSGADGSTGDGGGPSFCTGHPGVKRCWDFEGELLAGWDGRDKPPGDDILAIAEGGSDHLALRATIPTIDSAVDALFLDLAAGVTGVVPQLTIDFDLTVGDVAPDGYIEILTFDNAASRVTLSSNGTALSIDDGAAYSHDFAGLVAKEARHVHIAWSPGSGNFVVNIGAEKETTILPIIPGKIRLSLGVSALANGVRGSYYIDDVILD